jgi:hypothetical protein
MNLRRYGEDRRYGGAGDTERAGDKERVGDTGVMVMCVMRLVVKKPLKQKEISLAIL